MFTSNTLRRKSRIYPYILVLPILRFAFIALIFLCYITRLHPYLSINQDMFPYLQVIAFIDASQMYEDTLLQLRQRMPSLKEEGCLFGYVRFVSRDTYRTYH